MCFICTIARKFFHPSALFLAGKELINSLGLKEPQRESADWVPGPKYFIYSTGFKPHHDPAAEYSYPSVMEEETEG